MQEVLPLRLITIEYVDINFPVNAPDTTFGRELPDSQAYVGFILAIAGYPDLIVMLQFGCNRKVFVNECLTDI